MANYINFTKAIFNPYNLKVLNEGQFSWMTHDTDKQIGSERENTIIVYMYDNEGNQWHEKNYEGYGEFGKLDYYELLAKMNGFTEEDLEDKVLLKSIRAMSKPEMRDIGIALAFDPKGKKIKTRAEGGKVLFPALVEDPKFNWKRHDFTQEAESDPNQSWYQEPEYDDDYDDDYEQGWYESLKTNEGAMSEIYLMANDAKNEEAFKKQFYKEYGAKVKKSGETDKWIKEIYVDATSNEAEFKASEAVAEARYDKKKLLKLIKNSDDAEILVNGEWYIIYNPDNGNDENTAMWAEDDVIFALTPDGDEKEIKYSDIEKFQESVVKELTWDSLKESLGLNEAKFVKEFDEDVLDAEYKADITTYYPSAQFFIGKHSHFFGELEPNLFFKAYYAKYYKQDTGKKIDGEFKITSIYSKKGSNYVHLYNELTESVVEDDLNEGRSINKISKDHAATVSDMAKTVGEWKTAEGDRKTELLELLRELNKRKAELETELDDAVVGKDRNVQLALEEAEELAYLDIELNKIFENEN